MPPVLRRALPLCLMPTVQGALPTPGMTMDTCTLHRRAGTSEQAHIRSRLACGRAWAWALCGVCPVKHFFFCESDLLTSGAPFPVQTDSPATVMVWLFRAPTTPTPFSCSWGYGL